MDVNENKPKTVDKLTYRQMQKIMHEIVNLCTSEREYIHSNFRDEVIDLLETNNVIIPWDK